LPSPPPLAQKTTGATRKALPPTPLTVVTVRSRSCTEEPPRPLTAVAWVAWGRKLVGQSAEGLRWVGVGAWNTAGTSYAAQPFLYRTFELKIRPRFPLCVKTAEIFAQQNHLTLVPDGGPHVQTLYLH
jgi:hypothetical protein